jgi:hypothetical protein
MKPPSIGNTKTPPLGLTLSDESRPSHETGITNMTIEMADKRDVGTYSAHDGSESLPGPGDFLFIILSMRFGFPKKLFRA